MNDKREFGMKWWWLIRISSCIP